MRHAFGSQLAAAGVPLTHIQRLMGHKAIATTMRYAKHQPDDAGRLAIARLEQARHSNSSASTEGDVAHAPDRSNPWRESP
ncbi:MAG: site-specific integrase [Planctomycetota bacterium]